MPDLTPDMSLSGSSVVNKVMQERKSKEHEKLLREEQVEEWRKAVNRLAVTDDGKLLIKHVLHATKMFTVDTARDPAAILQNNAKRSLYLQLFREYLTPEVRTQVENQ